jgi:hypothetical protein
MKERVITSAWVLLFLLALNGCRDSDERPLFEAAYVLDADSMYKAVQMLAQDSFAGRYAGSDGGKAARDYIVAELDSVPGLIRAGTDGWLQTVDVTAVAPLIPEQPDTDHPLANILAIVPGSDPLLSGEYIVLSAHYDHLGTSANGGIFRGATDNAGGVAIVLELARYLAAMPVKPRRSVLIAFWDAEELGLIGSRYFVANPTVALGKIRYMFSLDGWGDSLTDSMRSIAFAVGANVLPDLQRSLEKIPVRDDALRFYPLSNLLFPARSDHWPFQLEGIPAVHLTSGQLASRYHSVEDTPQAVRAQTLLNGARLVAQLLLDLGSAELEQPGVSLPGEGIYYRGDLDLLITALSILRDNPNDLDGAPETFTAAIPEYLELLSHWRDNPPPTSEAHGQFQAAYIPVLLAILGSGLVP